MNLHFRSNQVDDAVGLVKRFHYSGRAPSNVQFVGSLHRDGGLFGDFGEIVAACFFSIPPTRWSEDVWELSRLVRDEGSRPTLSSLVAASARFIRASGGADLLVSFADRTAGHHGGIYQACSWDYNGQRSPSCDGVLIDGRFIPGRSCVSTYGTRSPDKLREILPGRTIEPHWDEGKHLYWKALNRSGKKKAARLGLSSMPYPKPDKVDAFG